MASPPSEKKEQKAKVTEVYHCSQSLLKRAPRKSRRTSVGRRTEIYTPSVTSILNVDPDNTRQYVSTHVSEKLKYKFGKQLDNSLSDDCQGF